MNARMGTVMAVSMGLLAIGTTSCTLSLIKLPGVPTLTNLAPGPALSTPTLLPKAQTTFIASLSEPLASGEILALGMLDEVTGLALNAQLFPMQAADASRHTATLALSYGAVVRYHYVRLGALQASEVTPRNDPIRYRLYSVAGQAEVNDRISGWTDRPSSSPTGSIQGRVLNADTGVPLPDILVTAAGQRVFSDSAGRFELQAVAAGTHNLVAYSLDGTYSTFQQGATVAQGLNTAVEINSKAAPLVRLTFVVKAPGDVQGEPVRIAGNLLELGNTFAELRGGMSTVADRMPVMSLQPDGRYTATLSLPAGAYVQYKYTLGDGFWNAEHTSAGPFALRELIVPSQDAVIHDTVDTWRAGNASPILFEVTVASKTPVSDLISIQFNPYGWTEPIPMWPMGNNRWAYKLYGPVNGVGSLHYRYCRNGQCGSADDLLTAGDAAQGRTLETSLAPQNIQDTISDWAWLEDTEPNTLVGAAITARPSDFVAGVEFQSSYRPNWSYYIPLAIQNAQALGVNWLFFAPSWTYTQPSPLEFGLAPEHDPFWLDSAVMISQARAANLNVGIFPVPQFATTASDFWNRAPGDVVWWQNWFDHYRAFLIHHADLAAQTGAQALVLGGDWLQPALPGGAMADGSASTVPGDAEARWQAIFSEVRRHFAGKVWWALPYAREGVQLTPAFLSGTDGVYVLWDAPLATQSGATKDDMIERASELLDNEVQPLAALLGKPIMLALAYPSATGVESGCFDDGNGGCLAWTELSQPRNPNSVVVDLRGQADVYEAMLNAINSRPYVAGVISRGYYPPTMLQDKSASVRGKPAADLLWYWFPRLTGVVN